MTRLRLFRGPNTFLVLALICMGFGASVLAERAATPSTDGAAHAGAVSAGTPGGPVAGGLGRFGFGGYATYVSLNSSNYSPTHGTTFTVMSSVTDISGQTNGAIATGSVTFTDSSGNVLGGGAVGLVNGTANLPLSSLPGGSITITATYSGDANYAGKASPPITITVQPEAANFTATAAGSAQLGSNIPVTVKLQSASGVGTPTGTVYGQLQGAGTSQKVMATLSGSNGVATATLLVPALLAGAVQINVTCTPVDPSFSCYPTLVVTANVTPGSTSTSLVVNPYPISGGTEVLTATVATAATGTPTPQGNVSFYDNGVAIGSQQLGGNTATFTATNVSAGTAHSYTAVYNGDNNYMTSTSNGVNGTSATATTSTALTLNPTTPVNGSLTTLRATVTNNGAAATPTGTVMFFEDGGQLGSASVSGGVATFTSMTISGTTAHTFSATYEGDTANAVSQSSGVVSNAGGNSSITTQTTVSGSSLPTKGQATNVTAAISVTGTAIATPPSGTVSFYSSVQGLLGTAQVIGSSATAALTFTTSGAQNLYAIYSGDGNYAGSQSPNVPVTVSGTSGTNIATQTSLSVSALPTKGQATNATAAITVTGAAGGTTPTGTVSFYSSVQGLLATAQVVGSSATAALTFTTSGAQNVYAIYSGDTNYAGSQSANVPVTVSGTSGSNIATQTSLSVSALPTKGQATNATAAITVTGAAGGTTPTGTVSFYSSVEGLLGTAQVVGSSATAALTFNTSGAENVYAIYSGDGNYAGSQSANVPVTVSGGTTGTNITTQTTLQVSALPTKGQATNATATVSITGTAGNTAPTGTVTFYSSVQGALGSAQLVGGSATAALTFNISGAQNVYAIYAGDTNYAGSQSGNTPVTVSGGTTGSVTTSTTVNAAATATQGVSTSISAVVAVTGTAVAAAPGGTVNFYSTSTQGLLGSGTLVGNTATANVTYTTAGPQSVYAIYVGDANYAGSTSPSTSVTVAAASTTTSSTVTSVMFTPTTPVQGSLTTVTATITNTGTARTANPTGTVTFTDSVQGLLGTATVNGSSASIQAAFTTSGVHTVTATYVGDTNYSGSTGSGTASVSASTTGTTATTTSVQTSSNPTQGVALTVSATVLNAGATQATSPTGTVNFTDSVQGFLGSAALGGSIAQIPVTFTTGGSHTITATYVGDATYSGSTGSQTLTVATGTTPTGPTQSLVVSPASPVVYGSPVTVTDSITGVTLASGTMPTGTVTFTVTPTGLINNGAVAVVATTATSGTATFTFTAPAPGSYVVTATCTGQNFTCSTTSVTTTIVVTKANTTTVVTSTPAAPVQGTPTLLTATIAPVAPSTATNFTGLVTFYDNGVSLGTGTVAGTTAMLSTTLNSTTANVITAVYSGDTNFNTSTSTSVNLVAPSTVTTGVLTVNLARALYTTNIILTANISANPSGTVTNPTTPYGTVTFYDLYNGQATTLGTGSLVSSGAYISTAQLSTIGLLPGTHTITAIFPSSSAFSGVISNAVTVNIDDYGLAFNPPTLVIKQGTSATDTLTINAINGFTGTVVLGCTPPSGTATTCSFSPAVLPSSGTSTLSITTAAPMAHATAVAGLRYTGFGVSMAALMGFLLWPKRRRPALLALVALFGLLGAAGCTNIRDTGGTAVTTGGSSGTPLGTLIFTITTSGTDGVTTNRHDIQLQVTVQ